MANAVNYAMELHAIRDRFITVADDKWFSNQQKLWLCKDLRKSLPARAMCAQCGDSYDIIWSLMTNALEAMTSALIPEPASKLASIPVRTTVVKKPKATAKAKAGRKVQGPKK